MFRAWPIQVNRILFKIIKRRSLQFKTSSHFTSVVGTIRLVTSILRLKTTSCLEQGSPIPGPLPGLKPFGNGPWKWWASMHMRIPSYMSSGKCGFTGSIYTSDRCTCPPLGQMKLYVCMRWPVALMGSSPLPPNRSAKPERLDNSGLEEEKNNNHPSFPKGYFSQDEIKEMEPEHVTCSII